jgi:monoamine oxidase
VADLRADVVVVGAGIAGLTAARALHAAGLDAIVLEARERLGGRLHTVPLGEDAWVDHGGQWIGPAQHGVTALARELGVETFSSHPEGLHVWYLDGRRQESAGELPRVNPAALAEIALLLRRLDAMADRVPLEAPWRAARAAAWDSTTIAEWLRRNSITATARELIHVMIRSLYATDPSEISLLFALFAAHAAGGFESMMAIEGGPQDARFLGGSGRLVEAVAAGLPAGTVVSGAPVRRLAWSGRGVEVASDAGSARASHAIVTVPPNLAASIAFEPVLPAARRSVHERYPMGAVIKVHAVYDEPFWRDDGRSGQAIDGRAPVSAVFDNSPPGGSPGILVGFIEAGAAVRASALQSAERRNLVLGDLARFFGPRAASPETYLETDWCLEPWTQGCYGGNAPPGMLTRFGPAIAAPVGPIHWAGAETATHWLGYIDGAIESGERAAAEILAARP